ncbi:MAG: hypothetical protein LBB55_01985 [Zoogloeaceae bacterium]|jgi:hypothetical protein|nr:hypothetical protein [Zoogloeaceae bacterium]
MENRPQTLATRLIFVFLLACPFPASSASAQEAESFTRQIELGREMQAEADHRREIIDDRLKEEEAACAREFLSNDCRKAARKRYLEDLTAIRQLAAEGREMERQGKLREREQNQLQRAADEEARAAKDAERAAETAREREARQSKQADKLAKKAAKAKKKAEDRRRKIERSQPQESGIGDQESEKANQAHTGH